MTDEIHPIPTPHDAVYKNFFSDVIMVRSLLEDFVSEELDLDFDFASLERVAGSYVTDDMKQRYNDIVWRVKLKKQGAKERETAEPLWCYLYLMIEFQSTIDPFMAVRILSYTALLWQDLIKQKIITPKKPLPPVLPIVIFSGNGVWTAKTDLAKLMVDDLGILEKYQPRQEYFIVDESFLGKDGSTRRRGLTSLLLRLERAKDLKTVQSIVKLLTKELTKPEHEQIKRHFFQLLSLTLRHYQSDATDMEDEITSEGFSVLSENFGHMLQQSRLEGMELGIFEGMERGKLEGMELGKLEGMELGKLEGMELGKLEIAKKLLDVMDDDLIAEKTGLSLDAVRALRK